MTDPSLESRRFRLNPQVSVRPEPFGALLYHFGNRKLSFLKDKHLAILVENLDGEASLAEQIQAAGFTQNHHPIVLRSLEALVQSDMLEEVVA